MSQNISLDVLIDSLLEESSRKFQETIGLKWEWEHYEKIHNLVKLIQEKEFVRDNKTATTIIKGQLDGGGEGHQNNGVATVSEEDRRYEAFPAFKHWLEKNGVDCDKIEIDHFGDSGFGLRTKVSMKAGDKVFDVPEKIILTSSKAKDSKLKLISEKDPILRSMQNVAIAMFLLLEKYGQKDSKESFWSPYITTLPSSYDTVLYFSKDEMSLLKYSPSAFREALKMYRNVTRQYAYFHIKFKKANDSTSKIFRSILTFNRYVWGVSSVTTRINHLPNPSEGEELMSMIPLWDLCNHCSELRQVSTDFDDSANKLSCYAARDFDAGDEFKIFYGHRNSIEYLVYNGFVPGGYRDDTYYLELGIGINDMCYARKKAVLGHVGLMCQNIFLVKPNRLMSAKGLFLFVRVFLADKNAMEIIESNVDQLHYLNEPTEQSLNFLITRFTLLKRSVENANKNLMKEASEATLQESVSDSLAHDRRVKMIAKILDNELCVLDMLISSTKNQLNQLLQEQPLNHNM